MKRTIPLLITAFGGIVLVIAFFIPAFESWGEEASIWFDILAAIAFILGGGNLFKVHLKTISDRKKGWGFSAVTLTAFLLMLIFGLFKFGSLPSPSTEFYGQSLVEFPLDWMPEYDSPGVLRPSEIRPAFPASIRRQLRIADGKIYFRGWASGTHAEALDSLDDQLAWRCSCERLGEVAQPPVELRGKVSYLADHNKLAFRGVMSPADEKALRTLFNNQPDALKAIDQLAEATRRKTTIAVTPPASFQIPEGLAGAVEVTPSLIAVTGPVSTDQRDELARAACHYPLAKPLSEPARAAFVAELEQQGSPLTTAQKQALDRYFNGLWQMDLFIQVLAGTGAPEPGRKTSCELLEEQQRGVTELVREIPATGTLEPMTDEQRALLKSFEQTPEMTAEDLLTRLKAAHLSGPRTAAVESFLKQIPTIGERNKALCVELLKAGSLSKPQRDWLLKDAREQYAWRQAVGQLFVQAHTVVYPWSGDYSEGGTPFDWVFTWVLQPLMTTTFALLAFYVASAAFRAFRAKNLEATLLLVTALIILFRATMFAGAVQVPLPGGTVVGMDRIYAFVMSVFNTAGNRAIMIGIALGIASTSLKVLLGIDRSYLGSDD
jgi:hypothetical protein